MNSEAKVGAFSLAGAAILAGMISFMGTFNFGSKGYNLTVVYPDAQGLIKGAAVRYAGVQIGTVKDIQVVNDKASVLTEIDEKIQLPKGAEFGISADGVMGEKFVNIMPPKNISNGYIIQETTVDGSVGGSVDDFLAQSTILLARVGEIVNNLENMLMNETIQKSMRDGAVNLTQVTENLKGITKHLQGITGVIDGVSQEPGTAQALRETISNVRDTSAGAKRMMNTISDVDVCVDAGHNMDDHWRGSMGLIFKPSDENYVYLGGYDIGDENKFDAYAGHKIGALGITAGAMQGDFGVGLSYDVIKQFKIYSQLYDFDNHKIRFGGEIKLNDKISVYGETMDLRNGTKKEVYAGVRARF